jgi:signal transduction histidine kinase
VGALPAEVAAENFAYPVQVGDATAGDADQLNQILEQRSPGSTVRLTDADQRTQNFPIVRQYNFTYRLITVVCGLVFWIVSLLVFATRTGRPVVRDFFWAAFLYGLAIMIGGVYFPPEPRILNALHPLLRILCLAIVPALFCRLGLRFPRERPILQSNRLLTPVMFGLPLALALWQWVMWLRYFISPDPARWEPISLPSTLSDIVLVAYFAAGCLLFIQNVTTSELSRDKDQSKWILYGVGIGSTPYVFLWTVPRLLGLEPVLSFENTRLFTIASPTAWAIAVVRHQFMDIDVVIRRSLIYAVLAGVMVLIYRFIGVWVAEMVEAIFPRTSEYVAIAAIVIPVILFNPTRKAIGRWVDRMFFKIQHNYQQAIDELHLKFQDASSHGQVTLALLDSLKENLHPKKAAILIGYQDRLEVTGEIEEELRDWVFVSYRPWEGRPARLVAAPRSTSLSELENSDFPPRFHQAGYLLSQTLPVKHDCSGLILLGQKESERRYVEEDIGFISSAAAEASHSLERLCLVQEVAEEAMERRRLDEVDQLKNDFLSRVAHDLRTPLTSIRWSSKNLLDGLAGEPTQEQRDYLLSIDASTSQLSRLVNNLLEISRLEAGRTQFEFEPVSAEAVIRSSAQGLQPIARSKKLDFRIHAQPELESVRANEEKLLEIINNMLENAIKFGPEQSAVEITLEPDGAGQRITIRDQGPGIPEDEREAIFERFKQGAISSTFTQEGFGLGLYVVKSFIELMNGEVRAENHPEGGAQFICWLPNWSAEEKAEI